MLKSLLSPWIICNPDVDSCWAGYVSLWAFPSFSFGKAGVLINPAALGSWRQIPFAAIPQGMAPSGADFCAARWRASQRE